MIKCVDKDVPVVLPQSYSELTGGNLQVERSFEYDGFYEKCFSSLRHNRDNSRSPLLDEIDEIEIDDDSNDNKSDDDHKACEIENKQSPAKRDLSNLVVITATNKQVQIYNAHHYLPTFLISILINNQGYIL